MKSIATLIRGDKTDATDEIMDQIRAASRFTSGRDFPDTSGINQFDGIPASILYGAYKSPEVFSETSAVNQYVLDESSVDGELSEALLQIGVIEMKHMDILSDIIQKLGGDKNQYWDNRAIRNYKNKRQIIENNINAEEATINYYTSVLTALKKYPMSQTRRIITEVIEVIIADERVHVKELKSFLKTV